MGSVKYGWSSLVVQTVKNLPALARKPWLNPGQEDPYRECMLSILFWRIHGRGAW